MEGAKTSVLIITHSVPWVHSRALQTLSFWGLWRLQSVHRLNHWPLAVSPTCSASLLPKVEGETESSHSPLQGCFPNWKPAPIHTLIEGTFQNCLITKRRSLSPLRKFPGFWSSVPEARWRPIYIFLNTNHNITGTLADHKLPPEEAEWGAFWSRALPLFFCWLSFNSSFDLCLTIKISVRRKLWKQIFPGPQVQGTWPLCFLLKPTSLLQGFYLTEENYLTEVLKFFLWVIALELFQFCQFWKAWV